ncbi:TPA: hypothetical protein ACN3HF_002546 [Staphylococcus aureus]|uniref:hypothetical protein n=1 Tax=Staphylococcus aureus TaxID=1280 RepID=UPI00044F106E|nr:hypothetical protein [Staphylococcus aureus]EYP45178.1 hypothetical protein W224_00938 [Staphylococcus aureus DAR1291]EYP96082.1 hypothetical protein W242_00428 [Staphylococcus aureus DAR1814]MBU5107022.1 hypothetical protein [Staphylococcus aureus]OZX48997.1 phage PVL protein [Staphylococcus aureus]HDF0893548.1 hypothetical protein [Staphylococcus aureus]
MKIKIKKEMRLDELIKWARENPKLSKGKIFPAKGFSNGVVRFQRNTNTCSISSFISIDIPFVVEVEEEITEETVIPSIVVVRTQYFPNGSESINVTKTNNKSIKELVGSNPDNSRFKCHEFYLMNGKGLGELIWKDGKLLV